MLTEIYCEAFGKTKRIPFFAGLNVIQGIGGNSIGKSNALKIIDYAFGGRYYAESNDDVIKHIGDHDICFAHTFDNDTFYFKRNAKKYGKILKCTDDKYIPQSEISESDFCKWLCEKYEFQNLGLTFREMIGLYARVWNKPNKEVSRPLYNHNAQTVKDAIVSLIKLFDEYGAIKELNEHDEYLRKRSQILSKAVSYHLLKVPSQKEYTEITSELAKIKEKILQLKTNIAVGSFENAGNLNDQKNDLFEQRSELLVQQGRIKRDIQRCEKNIQKLYSFGETTFSQLTEFFPEVNIERIKEVQGFHESLRAILMEELRSEVSSLTRRLAEINEAINNNQQEIERITGLPTRSTEAMDKLLQLIKIQEQLQSQIELYDDKVADAIQKDETKGKLDQLLNEITSRVEKKINTQIKEYSDCIETSNGKAPILHLSNRQYDYGVEDNTGTGKAYTDLILFDLAVLSLTKLPVLIHDSFLFNNIDDLTKRSFLRLYNQFGDKQVFVSLDTFLGYDNQEINDILYSSTRLVLSENEMLFGKDWRLSE